MLLSCAPVAPSKMNRTPWNVGTMNYHHYGYIVHHYQNLSNLLAPNRGLEIFRSPRSPSPAGLHTLDPHRRCLECCTSGTIDPRGLVMGQLCWDPNEPGPGSLETQADTPLFPRKGQTNMCTLALACQLCQLYSCIMCEYCKDGVTWSDVQLEDLYFYPTNTV